MKFLRRILFTIAASVALASLGLAAPATVQDLGQGLGYLRVHALADDAAALETALAAGNPLIVDLRHATASDNDAGLLEHAFATRHGAEFLSVLVGPATPAVLAKVLADSPSRAVTFGIAGSTPAPRVQVGQTAEKDQQAYDAVESGTPLATLLSGKIEKDRYDEAALMNDFSNGNTSGEPPAPDPKAAKADEKPTPLVDRVLQRAMNLHRALAAIKARS